MYQISLLAAYVAGMVALFAPCCISYLFPAYLGNVFRERKQVIGMTIVYSLGIFAIMTPVVLGARALSTLFFNLHDYTYVAGGIFMIFVGFIAFLGLKLPMPQFSRSGGPPKNDIVSTFTLGIFSGITSACCAPVLIGVITLTTLAPSTLQSLGIGFSYVLGMVTPLYLASAFIHKRNILKNPVLKRRLFMFKFFGTEYPIFVSNLIAALIFIVTGVLMLALTYTGSLGMSVAESQTTKAINQVAFRITELTSGSRLLDLAFVILIIYGVKKFFSLGGNIKEEMNETKYTCPMHPEVESSKQGMCPKCGMKLVSKNDKVQMNHSHHDMMASPEAAQDFLKRFFIVTALLVPLFVFKFMDLPLLQFAVASVIFYFGLVFFEHARHEIAMRQYGMMTLVSIAVGAGYLFSAASTFLPSLDAEFYLEISTLIWVLLLSHFLEAKSSMAAGDALGEVAKLLPKKARMLNGDMEHEVDVNDLSSGDVVRVLAGEKVPADGEIIKGFSNFDEAHITGESKPVKKSEGESVVAGAICIDGSVDVRLTRVGEHSTIGQIRALIVEAARTKPSQQKLADRAAKWLTFGAILVAIFTIFIWLFILNAPLAFALTLAITVLVIACPHALGLAIPTVSTIATRLAVANGLFVKDMGKMEIAKNADYVVFDKTGTLTEGNFTVTSVMTNNQITKNKLLEVAASIEAHSSHFIGRSIVQHARQEKIRIEKATAIKTIAGRGIEGKIGGKKYFVGRHKDASVAVLEGKNLLGEIVLSDKVKKESKVAVNELHDLGIKVAILTGDSEEVAKDVARELGVDQYFSEVLPEDKYKHIKKLQSSGNIVLMVGDGVNDAPALTQADVGVAVGAGTDVAVEAGDVVLTSSDPRNVVSFIKLSRKVYTKMIQNLFWALGYNVVAIPAAAGLFIPLGFRLTPAIGALLMSMSSVIVVANALSLRKAELS